MKMLVLADDFTGANDTGVQFCKKQAVVDVALNWEHNDNCQQADVTVVNTDSRALSINDAKQRIKTVLAHYPTDNITLYKKIDSTLRGNVGAELETALEASNRKIAFFCPALPNMGRTVQQGVCYVNRQPLAETEFATDPKTPIHSSEVSAILASQTALPILDIDLEILRSHDCLRILNQLAEQHPRCIFCFDAVENEDLSRIADCIAAINEPCIIVGSSGLASYLPETLYRNQINMLPLLFVVASMSQASNQQSEALLEQDLVQLVQVDVASLLKDKNYHQHLIEQVSEGLSAQHNILLKTDSSPEARQGISALCTQLGLNRTQLGEQICSKLSAIVIASLKQIKNQIAGLVLTGGDIAISVAQNLQATHYRIAGEIENGVPFGYLPNTALQHIPIVTKAGGFGSPTIFIETINFIRNHQ